MKVTLQPSGAVLDVERGELILDAARRLGYDCPQACRNGNCQICAALLVNGRVRQRGESHDHGEVFACLAEPEEDCVLLWDGVLAPGELPVRTLSCQLISCEAVGGDVFRLLLRAPAGKPPRYHAGQYLLLPFGDTHLAELPDGPLVLIAAGTGMAQMHSLIEHCRAQGFPHPVHLYWGVRRPEDFYQLPHWDEWQSMPNLQLHQVVSDVCGWPGRCGMLHEAVCEDFSDLKPVHVYASGSPAMIYGTLDALVEAGMDATQMRADVFAYAPRAS